MFSRIISHVKRNIKRVFILSYILFLGFFMYSAGSYFSSSSPMQSNDILDYICQDKSIVSALSKKRIDFVVKRNKLCDFLSDIVLNSKEEDQILSILINYMYIANDLREKDSLSAEDIDNIALCLFDLNKSQDSNGKLIYKRLQ